MGGSEIKGNFPGKENKNLKGKKIASNILFGLHKTILTTWNFFAKVKNMYFNK